MTQMSADEKVYPQMTQMSADKKVKLICVHLRHLRIDFFFWYRIKVIMLAFMGGLRFANPTYFLGNGR